MTKRQILKALADFNDDDKLMIDGRASLGNINRICGKTQYAMPYVCILEPNHSGDCFCGCKNVYFKPE